jgi:hypothetical protein
MAVAGGPGSISVTVTGNPKRHIRIQYGVNAPATTTNELIAFINGDNTSQGTYGIAQMIKASTTTGSGAFNTAITKVKLQGGYDAEAHLVTSAQLADFFNTPANWLQDGDTLAIGFPPGPVEVGVGLTGGRRQSLYDTPTNKTGGFTSNITPAVGNNLFNTAREPEKIPGSIPIGKLVNDQFIFIDGTVVYVSHPVKLSESASMWERLAEEDPGVGSGASLIGYDGSDLWNTDASGSPSPAVNGGPVEDALDSIVDHLSRSGGNDSGARRVGSEAITGSVTTGNKVLSLVAGSVRQSLEKILNATPSDSVSGGVNSRVSERGHYMHGKKPLEKNFSELTPVDLTVGGATFLRAELNVPGDAGATIAKNRKLETAFQSLTPLKWDNFSGQALPCPITLTTSGASGYVTTTLTNNQLLVLQDVLAATFHNVDSAVYYSTPVQIYGSNVAALDGWYWYNGATPGSSRILLKGLDGGTVDFTGLTSGSLKIYQGLTFGNTPAGVVLRGYHVAADNVPMLELAAYASLSNPLMRFWDVASLTANNPTLVYPDRIVFNQGATNERNTNYILKQTDKELLDGAETGVVVNAQASHHHGSNYTLQKWIYPTTTVLSSTYFSAGSPTLLAGKTLTPGAIVTPSGYTKKAVILNGYLQIIPNVGGAAGELLTVEITFIAPTTLYQGPTVKRVVVRPGSGLPTGWTDTFTVTVPLNNSGAFTVTVLSSNINDGASSLSLEEVGYIVSP